MLKPPAPCKQTHSAVGPSPVLYCYVRQTQLVASTAWSFSASNQYHLYVETELTATSYGLHGTWCFLSDSSRRRSFSITGMTKASVLPEPVCASTATSLLPAKSGIVASCTKS